MITRIYSASLVGIDAREVEVEVNATGADKPQILIVGLPDAAVRESSQRVTSAIHASALFLDDGIKTVNLAPADLKKEGPSFDLPIALAMVAASRNSNFDADDCCVVGELGLDGKVRPVKGVLSIACEARRRGRKRLLVPAANAREASVIEGIEAFPIRNLREAWDFLSGDLIIPALPFDRKAFKREPNPHDIDFADVKGQHMVKRALEVAAAGNHNLLKLWPNWPRRDKWPQSPYSKAILFLSPIKRQAASKDLNISGIWLWVVFAMSFTGTFPSNINFSTSPISVCALARAKITQPKRQ